MNKLTAHFLSLLFLLASGEVLAGARKWTVLVYWAVDNDLYEFSKPYLHQFEQIPDSDELAVVVEYDYPDERPTQRILVRHSKKPYDPQKELQASTVLEEIGETNSADSQVLRDFITSGMEKFPAENYLLVIGSHGSNWGGIIEDVPYRRYMSLAAFKTALQGKGIDLIVFDACQMAFLETLMTVKDETSFFVAAPFDLDGFDHVTPLKQLRSHPNLSPLELAKLYTKYYPLKAENAHRPQMMASLLNPMVANELVHEIEPFFALLNEKDYDELIKLSQKLHMTTNPENDWAFDLFDLIKQSGDHFFDLKLKAEFLLLKYGALGKGAILSTAKTPETAPHSGLSLTCAHKLLTYQLTSAGLRLPHWIQLCRTLKF